MIKKITAAVLAFALLLTLTPVQASAAGAEQDDLVLEASGNTLAVKLKLPHAKEEKLSSLQLTLELDAGSFYEFQFDQAVTGKAKTYAACYDTDNRQIHLYIAGTSPLFTSDTLSVGSVSVHSDGNASVEASGGDVMVVRGTVLEDMELSGSAAITFGADQPVYPPGSGYNPGNPQTPSTRPEQPSEPERPTGTPQEPQEPVSGIRQPALIKAQNAASGVVVKWAESSNAAGYYIYRKTPGGKWRRIANVTDKNTISYTDKTVKSKNGKKYIYTVKAYQGSHVSQYDKTGLQIYRLTAPSLSKPVSKSSGKMLITWKQNNKASAYQIQYARSADFQKLKMTETVKSVKQTSKTITKLTKKKTYYVRIRSYKKVGGVNYFSAWSSPKKVKTM